MTLPAHFRQAVDLLHELGITEPEEIEIETIAQHCGATVIERPLTGCEARVIGVGDRAVITVNAGSIRQRRRFSAAHELGHWMRDVGKVAFGCNPDASIGKGESNPETLANRYASDLLLPNFMFEPRATNRPMTFATVSDLAAVFDTSLTATAIRLIDLGSFPAILVCSSRSKVEWFCRGSDVPKSLWPQVPGRTTFASDLFKGLGCGETAGEVSSDQWFSSVRRHEVHEDSRRHGPDTVLTLLSWKNEDPLIEIQEEDDRRQDRRSDWRTDD